ncbi:hypothetical protein [Enterococcus canintestini]|uniref:hypothetical protein n=1 Tax=Enterococcus canintestini TaxID=317010 RepID=UPI00288D0378|nr:hypothetical protein [Enterococcus canintestini]MDT2739555.1 hypothetical protein [Enterococcus canintestini]
MGIEGQTVVLFIASLGIIVLVMVLWITLGQRKRITKLQREQEEFADKQEKQLAQHYHSMNQLSIETIDDSRRILAGEKEARGELYDHFKLELQEHTELMLHEVKRVEELVKNELSQLSDWQTQIAQQVANQQTDQNEFVDFVDEKLTAFATRSHGLPEQIEQIIGKMNQLRQLQQELAEFNQPLKVEKWDAHKKGNHKKRQQLVEEAI